LQLEQTARDRTTSLDGLRGLAALSVFLFHYLAVFFPAAVGGQRALAHVRFEAAFFRCPLWFLVNGDFAVSIFFVLSGYVLTRDIYRDKDRRTVIRRAVGRIFRLGIPAGASILFAFILLRNNLYFINGAADATGSAHFFNTHLLFNFPKTIRSLLYAVFYATWFAPPKPTQMYNLVLWTMYTELWGSMLVFGLAACFMGARHRGVILFVLALGIGGFGGTMLAARLAAFVTGSALAATEFTPASSRRWLALAAIACLLGSDFAVTAYSLASVRLDCLAAVLLLLAVVKSRPLAHVLSCRPLAYLGQVSFSLYLVHQIIIYALGSWIFLQLLHEIGYVRAALAAFICVLVTSFVLAHAVAAWIDRPSANLVRRLSNVVTRRTTPRLAAQRT
jgi:peptidoglycan/LPS O-acetylase OafA/YrhL